MNIYDVKTTLFGFSLLPPIKCQICQTLVGCVNMRIELIPRNIVPQNYNRWRKKTTDEHYSDSEQEYV